MTNKKNSTIDCEHCQTLQASLFGNLNKTDLQCIDAHKTANTYKRGQVIFHEGNRPLGLYCLQQGKVKIFKTGIDGREQIVRLAKAGDFIGYRAFLGEDCYSASAMALEDSQICFIDKNDFFHVCKTNDKLSGNLILRLSHELREAEDLLRDMAQKSVRERVAEILLIIREKYGVDKEDAKQINATLSREELASFVGTATETLIRILSDLKDAGVIDTQGKKIKILDIDALTETANLQY